MYVRGEWICLFVVALGVACQGYPFELREPSRVDAREIREVVAQLTPADILFVVDNSGSMDEEIQELQDNLDRFIDELSVTDNEFQVGIITTDMECNVPDNDCLLANGQPNPNPTTSANCCNRMVEPCVELDQDGIGGVDSSTCDGGRLRAATASGRRVFTRPAEDEREEWTAEVNQAIEQARNELLGSTYEAGLLAASTAVACAIGDPSCPDPAVSELNAGFIRDDADLVLIFLSDEDDCSVANIDIYSRPPDINNTAERATRFCAPIDCYAYYAREDLVPPGGDGLNDFVNEGLLCEPVPVEGQTNPVVVAREENPPALRQVDGFLDDLIALKGSVAAIRGAGIISATATLGSPLGFAARGCFAGTSGPSDECGCLSGSANSLNCIVTERNGQRGTPQGVERNGRFGCETLPSGRYADFLTQLANRRIEASRASDVLIDSICNSSYNETLSNIVNNVILSNCFALGQVPVLETDEDGTPTESITDRIQVTLNGSTLPNVSLDSPDQGWSWIEGSDEICLEGGLTKSISDEVEILVLQ